MSSRILRHLIFLVLIASPMATLFGYSSFTQVITRNTRSESLSTFSVLDTKMFVEVEATFCVNPAETSGTYQFSVQIFGPKGKLVHSDSATSLSIPSSGKIITHSFAVPIKNLSDGIGVYQIKGIYKEVLSASTNTSVGEKKILYSSHSFGLDQQLQRTRLTSPADGESVDSILPFFTWQPPHPFIRTRYSLWVGENKDPRENPLHSKKSITDLRYRYPVSAAKLEYGKTYYWMVQALDENNQPLGGLDGYSEIFRFQLSDQSLREIELVSPVDENVSQAVQDFTWRALDTSEDTDKENPPGYRLSLFTDEGGQSLIWAGETGENFLPVAAEELALKAKAETLFWRVEAYDLKRGSLLGRSKVAPFRMVLAKQSRQEFEQMPGKSGIRGTIRNLLNERLPDTYVVIAKELKGLVATPEDDIGADFRSILGGQEKINGKDYQISAGALTFLSDRQGEFFQEVPPGKYQIAFFQDNYALGVEHIEIVKDKFIRLDEYLIPVFGSIEGRVVNKDTGDPLAGTIVGFRNSVNYQQAITDERGHYNIPRLINGTYVLEVLNEPNYKEIIETGFKIAGRPISRDFRLEPIKAGILAGKITVKENNTDIADAYLFIRPILVDERIATGSTRAEVFSDANGNFSMPDLKIGLYRLFCEAPGFPRVSQDFKIESGMVTNIQIDLSSIRWQVKGRVVDDREEALRQVTVTVLDRPDLGRGVTDLDGNFLLKIPTGRYKLQYYLPGKNILLQDIKVELSDMTAPTVTLNEIFGTLSVRLFDTKKQPLGNVKMQVSNNGIGVDFQKEFTVDATGKLNNVFLPGNVNYRLRFTLTDAKTSGYLPDTAVFLPGGDAKLIQVDALAAVQLKGRVVSARSGAPVAGVEVEESSTGHRVLSDTAGNFTFTVARGPSGAVYSLSARHRDYLEAKITANSEGENILKVASLRENLSLVILKGYLEEIETVAAGSRERLAQLQSRREALSPTEMPEQGSLQELKTVNRNLENALGNAKNNLSTIGEAISRGQALLLKLPAKPAAPGADQISLLRQSADNVRNETESALKSLLSRMESDPNVLDEERRTIRDKVNAINGEIRTAVSSEEKNLAGDLEQNAQGSEQIQAYFQDQEAEKKKFAGNCERFWSLADSFDKNSPEYFWILIRKEISTSEKKRALVRAELTALRDRFKEGHAWFASFQEALALEVLKLEGFENRANNLLQNVSRFGDKFSQLEDSLEINQLGGFRSRIRLEAVKGKPLQYLVYGSIIAEDSAFGKNQIDISREQKLTIDLRASLETRLQQYLQPDFNINLLLPSRFAPLFSEKLTIDVRSQLDAEKLKAVETADILSASAAWRDYEKLNSLIGEMEELEIFSPEFAAISPEEVKNRLNEIRGKGAAAFTAENTAPQSEKIFGMNREKFTGIRESDVSAGWASLFFAGAFNNYAGKDIRQLLMLQLSEIHRTILPKDLSDTDSRTILLSLLPARTRQALPENLQLDEMLTDKVTELVNYPLGDFQQKLTDKFPETAFAEELPLKNDLPVNFRQIQADWSKMALGYDRSRRLAYLKADLTLDLSDGLSDLAGYGKTRSEEGIRLYGNGELAKSQLRLLIDKTADINLSGYRGKMESLLVDLRGYRFYGNGKLMLDKIQKQLEIQKALFDGNADFRFVNASVVINQPLRYTYKGWPLVFLSGEFDRQGVRLAGDMKLESPYNQLLKIDNALMDASGVVRNSDIRSFSFGLYGGSVKVDRAYFYEKTSGSGEKKQEITQLLLADCRFDLRLIQDLNIKRIFLQKVIETSRYDLQVYPEDLPIGREFQFSNFPVKIRDLQFREKKENNTPLHTLDILGAIDFQIPTVKEKEGLFRVDQSGQTDASDFLIDVNQGWLKVYSVVTYENGSFQGNGVMNSDKVSTLPVEVSVGRGRWRIAAVKDSILTAGQSMISEIQGEVKLKGGVLAAEFTGKQIIYTPVNESGGRPFTAVQDRLQYQFNRLDYKIRNRADGSYELGGKVTDDINSVVSGAMKEKLTSGMNSLATVQAFQDVAMMKHYADQVFLPNAQQIFTGSSSLSLSDAGDMAAKAADAIIPLDKMPQLPFCKIRIIPSQLFVEASCGFLLDRGGIKGGAAGNMMVWGKKNLWGAGFYVSAPVLIVIISANASVGVAVGHGWPSSSAYHGDSRQVPAEINGSLSYFQLDAGVTIGIAHVVIHTETWLYIGKPAAAGALVAVTGTVDFAIIVISLRLYTALTAGGNVSVSVSGSGGAVGLDDAYMAGTQGIKGCVQIAIAFEFCYEASYTITIGNPPAHISNGFSQQTTVKLDTAAILNAAATEAMNIVDDYVPDSFRDTAKNIGNSANDFKNRMASLQIPGGDLGSLLKRGFVYEDFKNPLPKDKLASFDLSGLKLPDAGNFGGWTSNRSPGNPLDNVVGNRSSDLGSDLPEEIVVTGVLKFHGDDRPSREELEKIDLKVLLDQTDLGFADVYPEDKNESAARWELRIGGSQLMKIDPAQMLKIRQGKFKVVLLQGDKETVLAE